MAAIGDWLVGCGGAEKSAVKSLVWRHPSPPWGARSATGPGGVEGDLPPAAVAGARAAAPQPAAAVVDQAGGPSALAAQDLGVGGDRCQGGAGGDREDP